MYQIEVWPKRFLKRSSSKESSDACTHSSAHKLLFFLKKSLTLLLSLQPQLKVTPVFCCFASEETAVSFTFLQQHLPALFPPTLSPHPGSCLFAPLATLPWCRHCPLLFVGTMGFLWYEKIIKMRFENQHFPSWVCHAASQALRLAQQGEGYKSSWSLLGQQQSKSKIMAIGLPPRRVAVGVPTSTCSPRCYCKANSAACKSSCWPAAHYSFAC